MREHYLEQVRPHIGDRAHQQTPGATTGDREPVGRSITLADQGLGHRDKIGKRLHLVEHAPRVVPCLAEVAATTDMGDGVDDAAVEQAQPVR